MLRACDQRFDVAENLENFYELNKSLVKQKYYNIYFAIFFWKTKQGLGIVGRQISSGRLKPGGPVICWQLHSESVNCWFSTATDARKDISAKATCTGGGGRGAGLVLVICAGYVK